MEHRQLEVCRQEYLVAKIKESSMTSNPVQTMDIVSDDKQIFDLVEEAKIHELPLYVWTIDQAKEENRVVYVAIIKRVDQIKKIFDIVPLDKASSFELEEGQKLMCYCKEKRFLFKTTPRGVDKELVLLAVPNKVSILNEEAASAFNIIEKENAEFYSQLRSSERIRTKDNQFITVQKMDGEESTHIGIYLLYDMSTAGMGFVVNNPSLFAKNDTVIATEIDHQTLPKPLRGKVMAIRQIDEENILQPFKVGVKFDK